MPPCTVKNSWQDNSKQAPSKLQEHSLTCSSAPAWTLPDALVAFQQASPIAATATGAQRFRATRKATECSALEWLLALLHRCYRGRGCAVLMTCPPRQGPNATCCQTTDQARQAAMHACKLQCPKPSILVQLGLLSELCHPQVATESSLDGLAAVLSSCPDGVTKVLCCTDCNQGGYRHQHGCLLVCVSPATGALQLHCCMHLGCEACSSDTALPPLATSRRAGGAGHERCVLRGAAATQQAETGARAGPCGPVDVVRQCVVCKARPEELLPVQWVHGSALLQPGSARRCTGRSTGRGARSACRCHCGG
jgi:hypothetical protein